MMVDSLLREIKADLPQYLDLQFMTVTTMVRNKAKLNRLMRTTAGSAMTFMRRSGIYFGFLIGLVQAAAWGWIHALWLMPGSRIGPFRGAVEHVVVDAVAFHIWHHPFKIAVTLWLEQRGAIDESQSMHSDLLALRRPDAEAAALVAKIVRAQGKRVRSNHKESKSGLSIRHPTTELAEPV